jgi:hypothetical protein
MNTIPDNQPPTDSQHDSNNEDNPPSPVEFAAAVRDAVINWLQGYWNEPREKSRRSEIAMIILTLLIAVAAFWSACIFQEQLNIARRQFSDAADDARSSRRHVRQQLAIAQASVDATDAQMRLDQRAWVAVSDVRATDFAIGLPFVITVVFKNTGKTPAEHFRVASALDPIAEGHKPAFADLGAISRGLLLPNGEANVMLNATSQSATGVTKSGLEQVKSGKLIIYVHGRITYDDVFGCHHWTTFCHFWQGKSLGICQEHNDTDHDSCQKGN